jgi:uncharacterized membrane-anchored protein
MRAVLLLTVCGFGCFSGSLAAQPKHRGVDDATFRRLARGGAFTVELKDQATFRVPQGYRFVIEEKLPEYCSLAGVPHVGDESGLILGGDHSTWYGWVFLTNTDPLNGVNRKTLSEPMTKANLLTWQLNYFASLKTKTGLSAVPGTVTTWTHPPTYDEKQQLLTMGVRLEAPGHKDAVCYQLYRYGPDGVIAGIHVMTDPESWDRVLPEASRLAEEFTFLDATPTEVVEAPPSDPMMHYLKVGGGGLLGAGLVLGFLKLVSSLGAGGNATNPPPQRGIRRPGKR